MRCPVNGCCRASWSAGCSEYEILVCNYFALIIPEECGHAKVFSVVIALFLRAQPERIGYRESCDWRTYDRRDL
jgi:hypothetical protein